LNNVARAAYHALAAVLGGAQSVHVDAYDEALCTPTELSSLTALRTQQIIQKETGVTNTVDPLGGSYFVEALTNQMEEKVNALLEQIDSMGGIVKAVEKGWVHQEISEAASDYQARMETGELPVVGVNCYVIEDEELPVDLFESPETVQFQTEKLKRIRKGRSDREAQKALDAVYRCCEEDGNLMEILVDAVNVPVTEGEISKVLKRFYSVWDPPLF
jgi:methylmalonyl-CoA mutase N-terminal domain/subunit